MKKRLSTTWKGIVFILFLSLIFLMQSCGGGGGGSSSSGSSSSSSGQALIGLTDAPGDFVRYAVNVTAVQLQKLDGTLVYALPPTGATVVDFTQLTNMTEFLTAGTVEVGTYNKVIMTLDYSNADIEVYDNNGYVIPIPVANMTYDNGTTTTAITSPIDLTVDLSPNLTVAVGIPVQLALDFNLANNNSVTFSGDTPSLEVSPVLDASLTPDTDKIQRFRGPLQSVNVSGNSFVMILRPFANALSKHDTSFGTMTVNVNSNTAFDIDGVTYTTGGLQALNAEPQYTAVIAHGTFDSSLNFTAEEVLAGSSVPGGTLDAAGGTVLSRSGNTLTMKGATLTRSTGTISCDPTLTVTLASTTKVSKQFSKGSFTISDISVGQHIDVLGTYDSTTNTMDATNGYVRMDITAILGELNYPASAIEQTNGWLSLSLEAIDGIRILNTATDPFDFAGTGTNSTNDASILDYVINPETGLDTSTLTTNHMPLRMKGFMAPFGSAPEDFDAQTIINLSDAKAFLNVGWGAGRLESDVFTSISTTAGLVLNGSTMSSVGVFHRVNRENDITDFVLNYPGTNPIVQPDGASTDNFCIDQAGTLTIYDTYAGFINALNTACTAGAKIRHLYGWGTFSDGSETFSAYYLQINLTKPSSS
jgi:hypothetical protein